MFEAFNPDKMKKRETLDFIGNKTLVFKTIQYILEHTRVNTTHTHARVRAQKHCKKDQRYYFYKTSLIFVT